MKMKKKKKKKNEEEKKKKKKKKKKKNRQMKRNDPTSQQWIVCESSSGRHSWSKHLRVASAGMRTHARTCQAHTGEYNW